MCPARGPGQPESRRRGCSRSSPLLEGLPGPARHRAGPWHPCDTRPRRSTGQTPRRVSRPGRGGVPVARHPAVEQPLRLDAGQDKGPQDNLGGDGHPGVVVPPRSASAAPGGGRVRPGRRHRAARRGPRRAVGRSRRRARGAPTWSRPQRSSHRPRPPPRPRPGGPVDRSGREGLECRRRLVVDADARVADRRADDLLDDGEVGRPSWRSRQSGSLVRVGIAGALGSNHPRGASSASEKRLRVRGMAGDPGRTGGVATTRRRMISATWGEIHRFL